MIPKATTEELELYKTSQVCAIRDFRQRAYDLGIDVSSKQAEWRLQNPDEENEPEFKPVKLPWIFNPGLILNIGGMAIIYPPAPSEDEIKVDFKPEDEALRKWLQDRGVTPIYSDHYWLEDKVRYEKAKDEDEAKHKREIARLKRIQRFCNIATWAWCACVAIACVISWVLSHGFLG